MTTKKVLIIGNFWPYRSGGGRIIGLANYLPKFDWHPIILSDRLDTDPIKNYDLIEASSCSPSKSAPKPCRHINFVKNYANEFKKYLLSDTDGIAFSTANWLRTYWLAITTYPDSNIDWYEVALRKAETILESQSVDAILSSTPITSHLVARKLKDKYGLPWVADFPDLWSQNHFYPYGRIRQFVDKSLEVKTLQDADHLTTVSGPWKDKLELIHGRGRSSSITHGYDPNLENRAGRPLTSKFTVTYTGTIYRGRQDIEKFLTAVEELVRKEVIKAEHLEIRFFGGNFQFLEKIIERLNLTEVCSIYDFLPLEEVILKQRESQLLLILNLEQIEIKGCHTLKLFSYLAARRPILVSGGHRNGSVIESVLKETGAGVFAPTEDEVKAELASYYKQFIKSGFVSYNGDLKKIDKYSHLHMAEKFSGILDLVSG